MLSLIICLLFLYHFPNQMFARSQPAFHAASNQTQLSIPKTFTNEKWLNNVILSGSPYMQQIALHGKFEANIHRNEAAGLVPNF